MRLRRISEELTKEYNKRKKISLIGIVVSLAIMVTIITLSAVGIISGIYSSIIYVALAVFLVLLKCLGYYLKLLSHTTLLSTNQFGEYLEINEKGIFLDVTKDSITEGKHYTWDRLNTMKGNYLDLSFFHKKSINYKMAIISDGKKLEVLQHLQNPQNLREARMLVKASEEYKKSQGDDFEMYSLIVEMYDEMAAEIKKYWKKQGN